MPAIDNNASGNEKSAKRNMTFEMEEGDENGRMAEEAKETQQKRAQLRHSYRNVIDHMQGDGAEDPSNLDKLNSLFPQVTKPREMSYDATAIALFASNQYQKVERLQTNLVTFNPLEFADKMLSYMDVRLMEEEDDEDQRPIIANHIWFKFGRSIAHLIKKSTSFNFMYGAFETGETEFKMRVRKEKIKDTEKLKEVVPQQVKEIDKKDQESTTEQVERIYSILEKLYDRNDNEPICYFSFTVDPNSYARTIENMFHIAFLIRDGKASLTLDEFKLPAIAPIRVPGNNENSSATKKDNQQIIMSMTQEEYKEIVETFKIDTAVITTKKQKH